MKGPMMPNLSNMLGDVYGPGDEPDPKDPEGSDDEQTPVAEGSDDTPEWASDDRLDAAFGDWTAGELPGTEPDQRESLEHLGDEPAPEPAPQAEAPAESETAEPNVRAVAAGELDRPPATEPKPAPAHIQMSDFTSVAAPPPPDVEPVDDRRLPTSQWHLGDDDILPGGGRRGLSRLLGR
jgi:hypothetical protein